MTDKDISAQEARLVEAYRMIVSRDPWLADMVMETVLDVAGTSPPAAVETKASLTPVSHDVGVSIAMPRDLAASWLRGPRSASVRYSNGSACVPVAGTVPTEPARRCTARGVIEQFRGNERSMRGLALS